MEKFTQWHSDFHRFDSNIKNYKVIGLIYRFDGRIKISHSSYIYNAIKLL